LIKEIPIHLARDVALATITLTTAATHAWGTCPDGSAEQVPTVAKQLEYPTGQLRTLAVDIGGSIRQLEYVRVGDLAIVEGDIVVGDARQLEFQATSGPIRLITPLVNRSMTLEYTHLRMR
jgi:hypothetical protein